MSAEPEPPVVIGSREQLLHLLAEASEIEHTLMCSYLYAAFSLKRAGDARLSPREGEAVERWHATIMDVCIQEMGHLLLVANLTVAVGGRPHLSRPNFPVAPGYFPSGVVVRLSGFSVETLDHFIFLERPRGVEGKDPEPFDQEEYDRSQARPGLMPSAQDYATIGHLYDAIRQNLRALSEWLGEEGLLIGGGEAQAGAEATGMDGMMKIGTLAEAFAAIDLIVEQGEGSPADRADSHYHSFLGIREELEALKAANPGFEPAWPVADSPVLRQPPEPEGKVFVDHPPAARVLDFACATYGLLLRMIGQLFGRQGRNAAAEQALLMGGAFDLMHVLGKAARLLAAMPATRHAPLPHAGMTFTMLRGVEPLLGGAPEMQLISEQLRALSRVPIGEDVSAALEKAMARFGRHSLAVGRE